MREAPPGRVRAGLWWAGCRCGGQGVADGGSCVLGDGGAGAGFVDEVFAGGAGGDERGDRQPVHAARFAAAGLVDQRDGVVGEQGVGAAGELDVVVDVVGGFLAGHAGHVAAHGDALFERGQGAELHLGGQGGLAQHDGGERGFGVELVVGQQPQCLQGLVAEQVPLIDTHDGHPSAFGVFGGQRVTGLGHQRGVVEAGFAAQRGDHVVIDAPRADGGVGDVDEVVAGGFGAVDRGAGGDGLADPDLAGDDGDAAAGDAVGDAGCGLGVIVGAEQHPGRQGATEGHGGEAEERLDLVQHGVSWCGQPPLAVVMAVVTAVMLVAFAARQVRSGLGLDHGRRDIQRTIMPLSERRLRLSLADGLLVVVASDRDFIAEEPGPLGASMGDQCLVRREIQFEVITQELRQAMFDLFGFGLGSGEPEQGVVGVTAVAQPPVARIIGVLAGQAVQPPVEGPHLSAGALPAGFDDLPFHRAVLRAWLGACTRVYPGMRTVRQRRPTCAGRCFREDGRCGCHLAELRRVAPHFQSSRYPAVSMLRSSRRNRLSSISPTGSRPSHRRQKNRSGRRCLPRRTRSSPPETWATLPQRGVAAPAGTNPWER